MKQLAATLLLAILLTPATLRSQEGVRLGLLYTPEYQPGLVVLPFGADGASGVVHGIIRNDLAYSDRFQMLDAGMGLPSTDSVNTSLWKERGADWVVSGTLRAAPGGGELRLVLYDAVYGRVKEQGAFSVPALGDPRFRMAVHAISDQVVEWATGEPGMAASRIAFVLESPGSKEIYLVDSDGENVQRVTNDNSLALSPAWSPDGRRIAYTSYRADAPYLYERDLTTGNDRMISRRDGLNITPAYSPDGSILAFATTVDGNTEIATYNVERNCCLEQQTRGRYFDSLAPSFSPDGDQFAFVSNRLGQPHIYTVAFGGEPRLVSRYAYGETAYNTSPDWSPLGGAIVYHSRVGPEVHQLVLADIANGGERYLTNSASNEDPSWAPDGRHVVFSSGNRQGGGLFVLDTVSGNIRTLLAGDGYGLPDWSPTLTRAAPQ